MTGLWGAVNLRLSVFSSEAVRPNESVWTSLTGQEEAENRSTIPGGRAYSGLFGGGLLHLTIAGKRVDIIFSKPGTGTPDTLFELPVVASLEMALPDFLTLASHWLSKSELPIVRIAFGAVLLAEVEDHDAAYMLLRKLLRSVTVDKGMAELIFRVNWPRDSRVQEGLRINRLTNWTVLRFILNTIEMGVESSLMTPAGEKLAVRLEIDHNTDGRNATPFDRHLLLPIFEELVTLARENAEQGELP